MLLKSQFVVGWKDNNGAKYAGSSRGYHRQHTAVGTTNGAGAHNVQIFILSKDLRVLHCLPGFWHPEDFARALRFGLALNRLWNDGSRTEMQRKNMFYRMHKAELAQQSAATAARSGWQNFDQHAERNKQRLGARDTFVGDSNELKPINRIVHERMLYYPFVKFEEFDVADYADLGKLYYDNNRDQGGARFSRADRIVQRQNDRFHRDLSKKMKAERARQKAEHKRLRAKWRKNERDARRRTARRRATS